MRARQPDFGIALVLESSGGGSAVTLAPIHPGEVVLADFLDPLALSQYRLVQDVSVPPRRINEIVQAGRGIGPLSNWIEKNVVCR